MNFKTPVNIYQKKKQFGFLVTACFWSVYSLFLFFNKFPEYNFMALLFLAPAIYYLYEYFFTERIYFSIDDKGLKKRFLWSKKFSLNQISSIEESYDYIKLHNKDGKYFKINPERINKDSKPNFDAFIAQLQQKLQVNV